jgi:hypothetical protein
MTEQPKKITLQGLPKISGVSCPSCGTDGKPVKTHTVRSLVRPEKLGCITWESYFFCNSPGCETVYFTPSGKSALTKSDLTVRVGMKESSPPRPICYCFDHTMDEIVKEANARFGAEGAAHVAGNFAEH